MSRNKTNQSLDEKLRARNPVAMREQRQVIKPVDILEPQTDKTTSIQVDKPLNPQVSNSTSGLAHKPTKPLTERSTSPLVEKPIKPQLDKATSTLVEKYTTHLRPDTIKEIKQKALDQDVNDYDIVQEALDQFFSLKQQR